MTGTIFDLYEPELPEGKKGFVELASKSPEPKDDSFFNSVKDYAKTILKGSAEGITRLGTAMGPLISNERKSIPQQHQEFSEALNEALPTDENFVQKGLRRGLKEAPSMIATPFAGPAQSAIRTGLASFAGQTAEHLGAPELVQTAAELTAFIGPDVTKKLLKQGKNKELIEFAKKMGMTDEQITPFIQSEFKQKWLSKISPKRGSTEKAIANTKQGLSETYNTLQKSPHAAKEISEIENGKLINGIYEKLNEMPREIRGKIEKDLEDLLNNKITGETLINFYKDVNSHFSGNTKQLLLLKKPVKEAIESISPELAKDFDLVNELYTKYYPIASKLKPNLTSDLINAAESIGILGSVTMGYYPPLVSLLGEKAAKKLAQQMLINPHLQQLSQKMVNALNENKIATAMKLIQAFSDQIKKYSPELSKELNTISKEEMEELLNLHHKSKDKQA